MSSTINTRPHPTCDFLDITPELAKQWLSINHANRRLIDSNTERLMGIIARGEWMDDSTDAIGLDVDGGIVNGQHRLKAVASGEITVRMLVVRNVRPEVILVIDQGLPRNLTQILQMQGKYEYAPDLASTISFLYRVANDQEKAQPRGLVPSVPLLLELFSHHPHLTDSVKTAVAVAHPFKGLHKGQLAAFHYLMATVDPDDADDFFEKLESGVEISNGEPVHALREKILANMGLPESKQESGLTLSAWIVKAWEAHREGNSLTKATLKWVRKGARAEEFPKISGIEFDADGSLLLDEDIEVEDIEEDASA